MPGEQGSLQGLQTPEAISKENIKGREQRREVQKQDLRGVIQKHIGLCQNAQCHRWWKREI